MSAQERLHLQFTEFAWNVDCVGTFIDTALQEPTQEVAAEFAARGFTRRDMKEAAEQMRKIRQVFYNPSQPI